MMSESPVFAPEVSVLNQLTHEARGQTTIYLGAVTTLQYTKVPSQAIQPHKSRAVSEFS